MLGLPLETALLVFGFPAFWLGYTAVFLFISRRWPADKEGGR